jgi:hypothetical protein
MEVLVNKKFAILMVLSLALTIQASGQATPEPDQSATKTGTAAPEDISKWLALVLAADGGGGFTSGPQPTAYAGVKLGVYVPPVPWNWNLNLGYDRVRGHGGFSTELAGLLPILRFPGPQKDESKNYLRLYAGPGFGGRAGAGGFGPYLSAHVMLTLFSDKRLDLDHISPYVEYERRFPFSALGQGDNRLKFGLMFAICDTCEF